jgi:hypothetical protein
MSNQTELEHYWETSVIYQWFTFNEVISELRDNGYPSHDYIINTPETNL